MKKYFILFFVIFATYSISIAQQYGKDFKKEIDGYNFRTNYDTSTYETKLIIEKDGKKIYENIFLDEVYDVNKNSLKENEKGYFFVDLFSGGAHCCFSLLICDIVNNKFVVLDTGFYGNSGYSLEDLNKDGVKEIVSGNDMFAYAFTNYSESRFPLRVQEFDGKKINEITGKFKDELIMEIGMYEADLNETLNEGISCPDNIDEETFNTTAGTVKTILAAIVADYYSLGDVKRGYELIDKVYKCLDKENFIKILKEDFKL